MKICVSGWTGLVGTAFCKAAKSAGHQIIPMIRSKSGAGDGSVYWNHESGEIDSEALAEADAVVHLAAENIATGRWNAEKKKRIRDSRAKGTKLIASAMASLDGGPRTFVSASAIGYYGSRGDEVMTEDSSLGPGFLAEVCRDWEVASQPAMDAGIRTVNLRIGVVLSSEGGALQKMLLPFKLGVGGNIGDGKQYMSWIAIDDLAEAIRHVVESEDASGPINAVSPNPVTNAAFTKTLGKVLRRPTLLPMPAFAAKLALGEMAEELLLSSTRVQPTKLAESGFKFAYPELEMALNHELR